MPNDTYAGQLQFGEFDMANPYTGALLDLPNPTFSDGDAFAWLNPTTGDIEARYYDAAVSVSPLQRGLDAATGAPDVDRPVASGQVVIPVLGGLSLRDDSGPATTSQSFNAGAVSWSIFDGTTTVGPVTADIGSTTDVSALVAPLATSGVWTVTQVVTDSNAVTQTRTFLMTAGVPSVQTLQIMQVDGTTPLAPLVFPLQLTITPQTSIKDADQLRDILNTQYGVGWSIDSATGQAIHATGVSAPASVAVVDGTVTPIVQSGYRTDTETNAATVDAAALAGPIQWADAAGLAAAAGQTFNGEVATVTVGFNPAFGAVTEGVNLPVIPADVDRAFTLATAEILTNPLNTTGVDGFLSRLSYELRMNTAAGSAMEVVVSANPAVTVRTQGGTITGSGTDGDPFIQAAGGSGHIELIGNVQDLIGASFLNRNGLASESVLPRLAIAWRAPVYVSSTDAGATWTFDRILTDGTLAAWTAGDTGGWTP